MKFYSDKAFGTEYNCKSIYNPGDAGIMTWDCTEGTECKYERKLPLPFERATIHVNSLNLGTFSADANAIALWIEEDYNNSNNLTIKGMLLGEDISAFNNGILPYFLQNNNSGLIKAYSIINVKDYIQDQTRRK